MSNSSTIKEILEKYKSRMFEYYESRAYEDFIGYPIKWDEETEAAINQIIDERVNKGRIAELELLQKARDRHFRTYIDFNDWKERRIKELE